jgi:hypothetical protein
VNGEWLVKELPKLTTHHSPLGTNKIYGRHETRKNVCRF